MLLFIVLSPLIVKETDQLPYSWHLCSSSLSVRIHAKLLDVSRLYCKTLFFFITITYLRSVLLLLKVGEKATKVKEYMKMMGLSESVYVISWFVTVAVPMLLLSLFLVVINYAFGVFEHSSPLLLILFYLGNEQSTQNCITYLTSVLFSIRVYSRWLLFLGSVIHGYDSYCYSHRCSLALCVVYFQHLLAQSQRQREIRSLVLGSLVLLFRLHCHLEGRDSRRCQLQ